VELYAKADKIILDESYILPLYQVAYIYGANKHLVWTPTPDESLFLNRMRWK
jgi:peptide/nickel transport system substrate-binding protein